jgi:hypothetical protein
VLAGIRNESEEFRILLDLQNREKPSAGQKDLNILSSFQGLGYAKPNLLLNIFKMN